MNQVQANHPRPEELASFARGELNDPSLSQIAEHLGQCSSCSSALKEIPDDRLASLARAAAKSRAVVHGGSAAATASVDQDAIPAALRVLDRYRVNERIGCGGMGTFFAPNTN